MDREFKDCKLCAESFTDDEDFFKHLRFHKITQAEYFQVNYPRLDRETGEIIKFKSRAFYFNNEFNSKDNFKKWITRQDKDSQIEWCKQALLNRKKQKNLIFSPCQVELRTIMIPSIIYLDKLFNGYYKTCEELGFKNRFKTFDGEKLKKVSLDKSKYKIIVDTREKSPLKFNEFDVIVQKVDEGDYSLSDDVVSCGCRIERKSLADFYGTLSNKSNLARFTRELERAEAKNLSLVILVESKLDKVNDFTYKSPSKGIVFTGGDYVMHSARELIQKFPKIQFLFVKDKGEAAVITELLFQNHGEFVDYDIQLLYDTGRII